ncbi:hypothetical protein MUP01_08675 [Candidatus Bathyarchaeota archaeon]|nr:hypothetical protein [Candidatus Bathyarchaeota archaeon]
MRPIYLGLVFFLIGVIGYLGVSVYYDIMSLQTALIYTFAAVAISSLPIAVILEVIRWRKGKGDREQKKEK